MLEYTMISWIHDTIMTLTWMHDANLRKNDANLSNL